MSDMMHTGYPLLTALPLRVSLKVKAVGSLTCARYAQRTLYSCIMSSWYIGGNTLIISSLKEVLEICETFVH